MNKLNERLTLIPGSAVAISTIVILTDRRWATLLQQLPPALDSPRHSTIWPRTVSSYISGAADSTPRRAPRPCVSYDARWCF